MSHRLPRPPRAVAAAAAPIGSSPTIFDKMNSDSGNGNIQAVQNAVQNAGNTVKNTINNPIPASSTTDKGTSTGLVNQLNQAVAAAPQKITTGVAKALKKLKW